MKNRSPVYNLIHQEMRACAVHLLEMGQDEEFSQEKHAIHVLSRLAELHQFASRVRPDEHYHPLSELKEYLENTMLKYHDEQNKYLSMRLSEVVSLLGLPPETDIKFKPSIVDSLTKYFIRHFQEEIKPGRALFKKLIEIKKI
jgi:hypothetical protein